MVANCHIKFSSKGFANLASTTVIFTPFFNKFGKNTTISVTGRHDPCVGIRAVPVGEAMLSCVLLDHYLMNKAQCD